MPHKVALCLILWVASNSLLFGRACTGAADCKACSTCQSCKHCAKEGGTCGAKATLVGGNGRTAAPQQRQSSPPDSIPQEKQSDYRTALLSLSDPAKLATLDKRGANPRLKKVVYWLEYARKAGQNPSDVIEEVLTQNQYRPEHARLIKINLLRNMKIGDELGFFTPENLEQLRHGEAPRVMRGPYAGDVAHVDHIIPVSLAPEIGNDLANLELMPSTLNLQKSAKVGSRQKGLARDLGAAGVISETIFSRIQDTPGIPAVESL